jgi:hypothetical protein
VTAVPASSIASTHGTALACGATRRRRPGPSHGCFGALGRADPGRVRLRFPEPVCLTRKHAYDLYLHCGVALAHIELLTGHPVGTIRQWSGKWRIPVRPASGCCPFLRRAPR